MRKSASLCPKKSNSQLKAIDVANTTDQNNSLPRIDATSAQLNNKSDRISPDFFQTQVKAHPSIAATSSSQKFCAYFKSVHRSPTHRQTSPSMLRSSK